VGDCGAVARALHHRAQRKDSDLQRNYVASAELEKFSISTI